MEVKDLIAREKRDFYNSLCLTGVIPFLVFVYLLIGKIASFDVLKGDVLYIMMATVLIFSLGIVVGRKMLWSLILKLLDDNKRIVNMQQELMEKNRLAAITETTLALGHEINNPLMAIRGNLELIDSEALGKPLPDNIKSRLDTIKNYCERIGQVTDKMSSLSKPTLQTIHGATKMLDLEKSK